MALKLILNIEGVNDALGTAAYGTAAAAIVERGTAQTGSYSAFATAALVAGQSQYEIWDTSAQATTSSWYRYRIGNGAGTLFSDYSDPFRATALAAYATLDELTDRLNLPDEDRYSLLSSILESVSAQMDAETGRQFYRLPQVSGDTTRIYDGTGSTYLPVPEGIVSVTTVQVRDDIDSDWVTLGTAEWTLRPANPDPGDTYRGIALTGTSSAQYATFPDGMTTVRVTGAFGWPSVPYLVREAVIEMAARVYAESQTRYGGMVGLPEMGQTMMPINRPDAWHRAVRAYARRSGVAA